MAKVLVLNASYEPLNITNWQRAVVLLLKGKAERLDHYSEPDQPGKLVRTGFRLPSVIRLTHYVSLPYKEVAMTRKNVLHRDGHCCQYCGHVGDNLTIDHVLPRSRGGADTWENMVAACMRCNVKKGNRTPKEAHMPLKRSPRQPNSGLQFEVSKHIRANQEWQKYLF
ncbi:MAG: HNH endonuclease [Pseudanabaenaceae cyanobacterium bins.68]|nr:HNH endonuclease [Pseudanabaenaceae cyanobacterium bins.68]